jgi:hypothetical protein
VAQTLFQTEAEGSMTGDANAWPDCEIDSFLQQKHSGNVGAAWLRIQPGPTASDPSRNAERQKFLVDDEDYSEISASQQQKNHRGLETFAVSVLVASAEGSPTIHNNSVVHNTLSASTTYRFLLVVFSFNFCHLLLFLVINHLYTRIA